MADYSSRSRAFVAPEHAQCADVNSLLELIREDHDWREEHSDQFLAEFTQDLWADTPDDDAQDDFRMRAETIPWWATDVVDCLERVLRDRPGWAPAAVVQACGRGPWLGDPSDDAEAYFDWLGSQTARMRAALAENQTDKG